MGAFAPQAFGSVGNTVAFGDTLAGSGIKSLIGTKDVTRDQAVKALQKEGTAVTDKSIKAYMKQSGSGFKGMSTTGKVLGASAVLPLFRRRGSPYWSTSFYRRGL